MISWYSKKQTSVALSTVATEHIAACSTSCEAVQLQKLLAGSFDVELETTYVSKHIEIRYHYIRDMV